MPIIFLISDITFFLGWASFNELLYWMSVQRAIIMCWTLLILQKVVKQRFWSGLQVFIQLFLTIHTLWSNLSVNQLNHPFVEVVDYGIVSKLALFHDHWCEMHPNWHIESSYYEKIVLSFKVLLYAFWSGWKFRYVVNLVLYFQQNLILVISSIKVPELLCICLNRVIQGFYLCLFFHDLFFSLYTFDSTLQRHDFLTNSLKCPLIDDLAQIVICCVINPQKQAQCVIFILLGTEKRIHSWAYFKEQFLWFEAEVYFLQLSHQVDIQNDFFYGIFLWFFSDQKSEGLKNLMI